MNSINEKVKKSTMWSVFTEIIVKIISPITNLILARILAPEAFGVVATVTMIVSFSDLFTDAGFQRFLIQHKFDDDDDMELTTCVAFWSNISISFVLWGVISIYADMLAILVGNPGLGNVIRVASIVLICTSFSSIQIAIYKKKFNFKVLSYARIVAKVIPFIVTIPLAIKGYSYWALIIGILVGEISNAIILTLLSSWKPQFRYSINKLKKMIKFCFWNFMEGISGWLVTNISIFIIGVYFSDYYLGIYKGSITIVGQIASIISSSIINVLFTTLSSLQNNETQYNEMVLKFQRLAGLLAIPLGIGIFIFRDVVTYILLGNQWTEACLLVGLWGFIMCESIIFVDIGATIILSKGKPKCLFLSNLVQILILIPSLLWCKGKSFDYLIYTVCLVRLQLPIMQVFWSTKITGLKINEIYTNIKQYVVAGTIMGIIGCLLERRANNSITLNLLYISICIILYFICLVIMPQNRDKVSKYCTLIKIKFNKLIIRN